MEPEYERLPLQGTVTACPILARHIICAGFLGFDRTIVAMRLGLAHLCSAILSNPVLSPFLAEAAKGIRL